MDFVIEETNDLLNNKIKDCSNRILDWERIQQKFSNSWDICEL
jgi:hypothetical protein